MGVCFARVDSETNDKRNKKFIIYNDQHKLNLTNMNKTNTENTKRTFLTTRTTRKRLSSDITQLLTTREDHFLLTV